MNALAPNIASRSKVRYSATPRARRVARDGAARDAPRDDARRGQRRRASRGIEGAATECEIPFSATHANHLRMDQYVMGCFDNVAAMLEWQDERVAGERRGEVIRASVDVGVAIKAESPR